MTTLKIRRLMKLLLVATQTAKSHAGFYSTPFRSLYACPIVVSTPCLLWCQKDQSPVLEVPGIPSKPLIACWCWVIPSAAAIAAFLWVVGPSVIPKGNRKTNKCISECCANCIRGKIILKRSETKRQ